MIYNLNLNDNDIKFMDEVTGNIILSKDSMPYDVDVNDTVKVHYNEDTLNIFHMYVVSDVSDNDIHLNWTEQLTENLLNESPVVTFDEHELVDPGNVSLKDMTSRAIEKEKIAKKISEKEKLIDELKEKNSHIVDELNASVGRNDYTDVKLTLLFDALVPPQGLSDSLAGELVRSIMRLLYRDHNDGDKFFEGYGLESCASYAEFLRDNGFSNTIDEMLDNAHFLSTDDDRYTQKLMQLAEEVVTEIHKNSNLLWTPNETDALEYSSEYITENQPTYELELYASDDIDLLLENDIVTSWDLNNYVEDQLSYDAIYNGATVEIPWTHSSNFVTVSNLTKDAYDYLHDSFNRDTEAWWEDFVSNYSEELSELKDIDEFDED